MKVRLIGFSLIRNNDKLVKRGEDFSVLNGMVEEPGKLESLGLRGVTKGTRFKIEFLGNVDWAVTIKGKTVHPAKVKFEIPGEGISVKLVPEKNKKGEAVLKRVDNINPRNPLLR
jgi:hypothetical protein